MAQQSLGAAFSCLPTPPTQTSGTGSKQGWQECTDRGSLFLQGAGKGEGEKGKAEGGEEEELGERGKNPSVHGGICLEVFVKRM